MSGYVHVYTGDGKGKTTAALGAALRAVGAGWNVFFAQFAKSGQSSELAALRRFDDQITVRHYGPACWSEASRVDVAPLPAEVGLEECREAMFCGRYRMIILDEANMAPLLGLFPLVDLLALIDARPEKVELVLTGRGAAAAVIQRADIVTEMREVKHYYGQGVLARTGVEK